MAHDDRRPIPVSQLPEFFEPTDSDDVPDETRYRFFSDSDEFGKGYENALNHAYKRQPKEGIRVRNFAETSDALFQKMSQPVAPDREIMRVNATKLSGRRFREKIEPLDVPVVLEHATDDWPAHRNWQPEVLVKRLGDKKFIVGQGTRRPTALRLRHFMRYAEETIDDAPYYIFDDEIERGDIRTMLKDYWIPEVFEDDLFNCVPRRKRPPYRWVLMGPKRSGSQPHQDPVSTSAWNTTITGRKRWVFFPPNIPKHLVYPGIDEEAAKMMSAITWFTDVFPRVQASGIPYYECIQYPGETMFVPREWWHAVLNLDFTIAVTQNFVSRTNFDTVWLAVVKERPRFAYRWQKGLAMCGYPELAERANELGGTPEEEWSFDDVGWTDFDAWPNTGRNRLKMDDSYYSYSVDADEAGYSYSYYTYSSSGSSSGSSDDAAARVRARKAARLETSVYEVKPPAESRSSKSKSSRNNSTRSNKRASKDTAATTTTDNSNGNSYRRGSGRSVSRREAGSRGTTARSGGRGSSGRRYLPAAAESGDDESTQSRTRSTSKRGSQAKSKSKSRRSHAGRGSGRRVRSVAETGSDARRSGRSTRSSRSSRASVDVGVSGRSSHHRSVVASGGGSGRQRSSRSSGGARAGKKPRD